MMALMADAAHQPTHLAPPPGPEEGIARLQELFALSEELLVAQPLTEAQVRAYKLELNSALTDAFGSDSEWTQETSRAGSYNNLFADSGQFVDGWRREIDQKKQLLASCIEELKRRAARRPAAAMPAMPTPLGIVENILRRFHDVAMQLTRRRENRKTLEITDEYDVQDLLHALLHLHFADIRREETGPSLAGARPRADFLLKDEQIFIEVKKTRESLTPSKLTEELLADISLYKEHPDCRTLVCFVYDPEEMVMNPGGFIRDIEKHSSPEMTVRVLVVR